jgi:hypothetical protein
MTVAKGSLTTKLYGNKNTGVALETQSDATAGEKQCPLKKTNVIKLESFAIEHSEIPGGGRIYSTNVHGVVDQSRVDI